MALPPELEEQFMTDIVAYEERERKPYVTSVERIASQRGLQEGIEKGRREMLEETLVTRFGTLPEELTVLLDRISDPQLLKELQRPAVTSDSLETFEQEVLTRL
jgi:predicted transposase YdaD